MERKDAFLEFAVGSHRDLSREFFFKPIEQEQIDDTLVNRYTIESVDRSVFRAGDCTVHHGWLWHQSQSESVGDKLRAAVGFSFVDANARKVMIHEIFFC